MQIKAKYQKALKEQRVQCLLCPHYCELKEAPSEVPAYELMPEAIIELAQKEGTESIAFIYIEPTVCFEYMLETAKDAGIRFVYSGNMPDTSGENTQCPTCRKTVIGRVGYRILSHAIAGNRCQFCGTVIPGRFC